MKKLLIFFVLGQIITAQAEELKEEEPFQTQPFFESAIDQKLNGEIDGSRGSRGGGSTSCSSCGS
ncbi:MAG: hypothetical protein JSR85_02990 [Proteobacteria bacterium]|nr:hypothetical protein [Pseudomonadota bacterium]